MARAVGTFAIAAMLVAGCLGSGSPAPRTPGSANSPAGPSAAPVLSPVAGATTVPSASPSSPARATPSPARATPTPAPAVDRTSPAAAFTELALRLRAHDAGALASWMGPTFVIGYWASEGVSLAPGPAVERLLAEIGPSAAVAYDPHSDPAAIVGDGWQDMFGPDQEIAAGGVLKGWGATGAGAAVAYLVETDGQLVWIGVVINPAGHLSD